MVGLADSTRVHRVGDSMVGGAVHDLLGAFILFMVMMEDSPCFLHARTRNPQQGGMATQELAHTRLRTTSTFLNAASVASKVGDRPLKLQYQRSPPSPARAHCQYRHDPYLVIDHH